MNNYKLIKLLEAGMPLEKTADGESRQVEQIVRHCHSCKWGDVFSRKDEFPEDSICNWPAKNVGRFNFPFYAKIAEKKPVYNGTIDHWFPRWTEGEEAKNCKAYEQA